MPLPQNLRTEEREEAEEDIPPVSFSPSSPQRVATLKPFLKFQLLCVVPLLVVLAHMKSMVASFPEEDYLYHLVLYFMAFAYVFGFSREVYFRFRGRPTEGP